MKYLRTVAILGSLFLLVGCVTNQLNSRLFSMKPALYLSKTKTSQEERSGISFQKIEIVDSRSGLEKDYLGFKNEIIDFWKNNISESIDSKIAEDLGKEKVHSLSSQNTLKIEVKSFYANISGFFWGTTRAVVWLKVSIRNDNQVVLENEYKDMYKTDGTDKDYEGPIVDTIEGGANIAIGMTLRITLDKFYKEYEKILKK